MFRSANLIKTKLAQPFRFFSSLQKPLVNPIIAKGNTQVKFTEQQFAAFAEALAQLGIEFTPNVHHLNMRLAKHATTHGFSFLSKERDTKITLARTKQLITQFGFDTCEMNNFIGEFDSLIFEQPGINLPGFLKRWKDQIPNYIYIVANLSNNFARENIRAFESHLVQYNEYAKRDQLTRLRWDVIDATPDEQLSPALQEIDIATKFKLPDCLKQLVIELDKPRKEWMEPYIRMSLAHQAPEKIIQFRSRGVSEANLENSVFSELACALQVACHFNHQQLEWPPRQTLCRPA